jgi:hypothetical protein
MTTASGLGAFPGTDPLDAQLAVLEELTDTPFGVDGLPFLTQLPARGPWSDATGRTSALLDGMPVELGPHGWKLADRPGQDQRRADAARREDLSALAIAASGYDGPLTLAVVGPWTLAATLYLARGDRVLADAGAVRELVASLAVGVAQHVRDVRAQVPGVGRLVVQLHEPLLGQVAAGVLPTFSGFSRLRAVEGPALVGGLEPVLDAIHATDAESVVRVGSAWVGVAPAVLAGARGVGLDLGPGWDERAWSTVARAVERGVGLCAGLPAARVSQCAGPEVGPVADVLTVPWGRIGLSPSGLADVTVATSTAPGEAPTVRQARDRLATVVRVAALLAERADA